MKKRLRFVFCLALMFFLAGTATASLIGSTSNLNNSNPATELAWLNTLINPDPMNFLGSQNPGRLADTNYNPGFDWDYALIKVSGSWFAYHDDGSNLLSVGPFYTGRRGKGQAISRVDFWGPGSSTSVPGPSTFLLLGTGLIGIAGWGRKKLMK